MEHISLTKAVVKKAFGLNAKLWISDEHRLIYLSIAKNANSFLKSIWLANHHLAPDFDPSEESSFQYLKRTGARRFLVCDKSVLEDSSYSKMVVLRDPFSRIISVYVDKVLKPLMGDSSPLPDRFFAGVSGVIKREVNRGTITFRDFVEYVMQLPDAKRNGHYRTQASFIDKQKFDFYGDVADMDEVIGYMQQHGMETSIGDVKSVKRTAYASTHDADVDNFADFAASEIADLKSVPSSSRFFDHDLLVTFSVAYDADLSLYCSTRGVNKAELMARYVNRSMKS